MHDFGTWPYYSKKCRADIDRLLKTGGTLSAYRSNKEWGPPPRLGSWAFMFERELEKRFNVKHAIAVNSGTMALTASLMALNLPPGSEVITTPYSFSATPASILLAGYIPRFADIGENTYNITPDTVEDVITKDTKAILPVDLFGLIADYEGLGKFGLPIIRDGCQSVGARMPLPCQVGEEKKYRYHFGLVTCASGNGGKNLPIGEGGFCLTNDDVMADRIRAYISHGENFSASEKSIGVNGRLPEMSACVAYHGLLDLEDRNKHRLALARKLRGGNGLLDEDNAVYVYPHIYKGNDRHAYCERVRKCGVPIGEGYMNPPLHRFPAFSKYCDRELPVVDDMAFNKMCILDCMRPPATMKDMAFVRNVLKGCL